MLRLSRRFSHAVLFAFPAPAHHHWAGFSLLPPFVGNRFMALLLTTALLTFSFLTHSFASFYHIFAWIVAVLRVSAFSSRSWFRLSFWFSLSLLPAGFLVCAVCGLDGWFSCLCTLRLLSPARALTLFPLRLVIRRTAFAAQQRRLVHGAGDLGFAFA